MHCAISDGTPNCAINPASRQTALWARLVVSKFRLWKCRPSALMPLQYTLRYCMTSGTVPLQGKRMCRQGSKMMCGLGRNFRATPICRLGKRGSNGQGGECDLCSCDKIWEHCYQLAYQLCFCSAIGATCAHSLLVYECSHSVLTGSPAVAQANSGLFRVEGYLALIGLALTPLWKTPQQMQPPLLELSKGCTSPC